MKTIVINHDNLKEEEVDEIVVRAKGLLIDDNDNIMLGYAHKTYQFPGGHVKEGEDNLETLLREIKEETGIVVENKNIKPFEKVIYYTKNYRNSGLNRRNEIYYYVINTNEKVNKKEMDLDDWEKVGKYVIKKFPVKDVEKVLNETIDDNPINRIITEEMTEVMATYREMFNKE